MKHFKILLLAFISLNSFAQTEWFPLGAKWYYTHRVSQNISEENFTTIEIVADTLILDKPTKKMEVINHLYNEIYSEYVYANNDSVFYFNKSANTFNLLYNFSALENDTVSVHSTYFNKNNGFLGYNSGAFCFEYYIDSVYLTEINSNSLKTQNLKRKNSCEWGFFSGYNSSTDVLIEKIGSLTYFFGNTGIMLTGGYFIDETTFLRCYEEPSGLTFKNPTWTLSCDTIIDLITNTLNLTKSTINLSPNPATDFIRMEVEGGNNSIQILNSQGQIVYQQKTSEKILNIHTQNFASGIYFVIVTHHNGNVSKGKFVKL